MTQETTIGACYRLIVVEGFETVVALNFANAFHPGGGYLGGARAQEECICRCSTLYSEIESSGREFYETNCNHENGPLATNYEIISTDVVVFRDDQYEFLSVPFQASFITSPAPEAMTIMGYYGRGKEIIDQIHDCNYERIERIIVSAIARGFKSIVLGAFGCGAFRNDPRDIARIFREFLIDKGLRTYFDKVTFAIFDLAQQNWPVFADVFKDVAVEVQ
jgi:uncharacterized protein (TIGR02452 family)